MRPVQASMHTACSPPGDARHGARRLRSDRRPASRRAGGGATHAWTEVYLPGAGWHGVDPTNDELAGTEHISVAVAREQQKASPLSGTWEGPPGAFERMEVSVQVEAL